MIRRVGLNQRFTSAGSVQARNTRSGGALSWRVVVTVLGMSVLLFQECVERIQFLAPEPLVARGPSGDLTQRRRPQLEVVLAAGTAPPYEACAFQDLQVLGDRVQRHGKTRGDIRDPGRPAGEPAEVVAMMRAAPRGLTRTGAAPARCRSKGPPSPARRASPGALRAGRPLPGTRTSRPLPRVRWRLAANGARRATQPGSMRSRASGCAPALAIPPRRRPLEALLHSAQEVAWRKSHTDRRSGWSASRGPCGTRGFPWSRRR